MSLPKIEILRPNLISVQIGKVTVWFSYEIAVAFDCPDYGFLVCENVWSATTGRHLSVIDDGRVDQRMDNERFIELLEEVCK